MMRDKAKQEQEQAQENAKAIASQVTPTKNEDMKVEETETTLNILPELENFVGLPGCLQRMATAGGGDCLFNALAAPIKGATNLSVRGDTANDMEKRTNQFRVSHNGYAPKP